MIARNTEFKEIHRYYQTRGKNSLKKMQSVIAVACKALRIFYAILTKGVTYDGAKMLINVNIKMYIFDHLRMYIFAILPLDRYIFLSDKIFL